MKVKAAEVQWSKSVDKYEIIRQRAMVSDGDSKSYDGLLELQPCGQLFQVEKQGYLNHIGKQMRTVRNNLVAHVSKRGITPGGRGHGALTGKPSGNFRFILSELSIGTSQQKN